MYNFVFYLTVGLIVFYFSFFVCVLFARLIFKYYLIKYALSETEIDIFLSESNWIQKNFIYLVYGGISLDAQKAESTLREAPEKLRGETFTFSSAGGNTLAALLFIWLFFVFQLTVVGLNDDSFYLVILVLNILLPILCLMLTVLSGINLKNSQKNKN